ncbi:MAG: endonuclease III domain-containing protein [Deltaproteobacteria bacterium]
MKRDARGRLMRIYKGLYAAFGPQGWWPGRTPLEVSVGAILTQNTNWTNVARAIRALRAARCLSFAGLRDAHEVELARLIRPAGYYNMKARRLKNFLAYLDRSYGGSFRRMKRRPAAALRAELLRVNGIGPETADSILLYALEKPVFVVDAYTKRVMTRHRLIGEAAGYDELKAVFTRHLPARRRLFNEYHALIVRLGKDYCKKTKPLCAACPLGEDHKKSTVL